MLRDFIDEIRDDFVDSATAPTRAIVYHRSRDNLDIPLNSYVGAGVFSKIEKETLEDFESFGGLKLDERPKSGIEGDTITYDGIVFKVRRVSKLGQLYTVIGEVSRHRGRATK